MITWQDFEKVDMRVGTVLTATLLENAKNPAYVMTIDFGQDLGIKKSSAQITKLYDIEMLIGQQVIAVVNSPPKQIGKIISECLVLGLVGENKAVTLMQPERKVDNGLRIM